MADLKFVDQHNMVACLEKTEENAEFHQIVDFLSTCSINYALTVVVISESSVRSDLLFNDEDGIACLTNDEIFENLALMGYEQLSTKLTFQKAQDNNNILKTQTMTMPNVDIPQGMDIGGSPRRQETMGVLLLRLGGYTPRSDEGRLKLKELMAICTKLSKQVLDLEKENDAQAVEILKLKQRVRKLERKRKSRISHPRRRIYMQVESSDDELDEKVASKQGRESNKTKRESSYCLPWKLVMLSCHPLLTAGVAISTAEPKIPPTTAATAFMDEDLTIAQTLIKMKEEKAKEKGVAIKDVEVSPRSIRSITTMSLETSSIYCSKRIMVWVYWLIEDTEIQEKQLDRAQKERQNQEEATSATLAEEFDEIQARIKEILERRKNIFGKQKREAIRNKPPTRNQVRNKMITYLKHIDDDSQQQAESTKKRQRADSEKESSKKQKLEEDNDAEKEELRDSMDVVPRDDVAIDVESLATKYPIIDWKTHILNENMMYYQIIRADGSSKNYKIFSEMLDDFDKELYDMKTLFEPNEEDEIWKNQQDYNLISWRLFDSCGVHMLIMKVRWHLSFSDLQDHNFRSRRVFGYILLVIKMLILKKLDDNRWFGEAEEAFLHNVSKDKETAEVGESSYRRLWPYIYCINQRIPLL
ncbi:hypothetical protein Tco_1404707 [Tanacetum coccineum]